MPPGCPPCPGSLLAPDGQPPPFDGPYIVKPALRGLVHRDRRGRGLRPPPRPGSGPTPTSGSGPSLEPYRPDLFDLQVAVRSWPTLELSAVERPIRASGAADILDYRDKYVAGEGMAGANRELPARIPAELEKDSDGPPSVVAGLAGVRGVARIDFLSDGTQFVVNEVNTIPGSLARYLWVDPLVPVRHPAPRPAGRSPPAAHPRLLRRRRRRDGPPLGRIDRRQVGLRPLAVRRLPTPAGREGPGRHPAALDVPLGPAGGRRRRHRHRGGPRRRLPPHVGDRPLDRGTGGGGAVRVAGGPDGPMVDHQSGRDLGAPRRAVGTVLAPPRRDATGLRGVGARRYSRCSDGGRDRAPGARDPRARTGSAASTTYASR